MKFFLASTLGLMLLSHPAEAASKSWTGSGGDANWYTANNWNPPGAPGSGDDAVIDPPSGSTRVFVSVSSPSIQFNSLVLGVVGGTKTVSLTISTTIANGGSLTIYGGSGLSFGTSVQSTLSGNVTMVSGSTMTHLANTTVSSNTINLSVGGNFTLQAGATITASGLGYAGGSPVGNGQGPGGGSSATGGGHGGKGGGVGGGSANDSLTNPIDLGSGGGGGSVDASGGAGGGAILLNVAGTFTNNGFIVTNGSDGGPDQSGSQGGGGGAGGTISLSAGTLTGSGSLSAKGGGGGTCLSIPCTGTGGGGGGRIRACAINNNFLGTAVADPGPGGGGGGPSGPAGTIGTIVSSTTLTDHAQGQIGNSFTTLGTSTRTLYRFDLVTSSGGVQINSSTFTLSNITALFSSNFAGTSLYLDANKNGLVDPGEIAVAGGTVTITGSNGTIAFSQSYAVTGSSTVAYILVSTVTLSGGNQMTVSLSSANISAMCPMAFTQQGIRLGSATAVTHTAPAGNPPPGNPIVFNVFVGSITVTYGTVGGANGYEVDASTASDFTGTLFSSATTNVNLSTLTPQGLAINTTYFLRAGAIYGGTTNYAFTTPASTATLVVDPTLLPPSFTGVFISSLSVQWSSGTAVTGFNPLGTNYIAELSLNSNFSTIDASSRTANLVATLTGLFSGTTYYARVRAVNYNEVPSNNLVLGSTATIGNIPGNPVDTAVSSRTISLSWSANGNGPGVKYEVSQSTDGFNLNITTPVPFAANLTATATTLLSLTPNTTYSHRLRAQDVSSNISGFTAIVTTVTLAAPPIPLAFTNISNSAFTANWNPLDNPPDTLYSVEISTLVDFSLIQQTSATLNSFATFSGLAPNTVFYVRLQPFNRAGTSSGYVLIGAVKTALGVITLSADALANVFTNKSSFTFSAQGAGPGGHYHWSFVPSTNCSGDPTGPRFDGSAMIVPAPNPPADADYYFCVLGMTSFEVQVGTSVFGPIRIDRTAPVITAISAQRSATDTTPIFSGQTSFSSTPRFTWPVPASFAPIAGYDFAVNNGSCQSLSFTITTTLNFSDQSFTAPGSYCVQVAALDLAGNWGPATSFTYVYTSIPSEPTVRLKNNYFNPLRGEKMTVNVQINQGGQVHVAIYNLLGLEVLTLAGGNFAPGSYDFDWDGRNSAGQRVATGLYLIHTEGPGIRKNQKCVVAK